MEIIFPYYYTNILSVFNLKKESKAKKANSILQVWSGILDSNNTLTIAKHKEEKLKALFCTRRNKCKNRNGLLKEIQKNIF